MVVELFKCLCYGTYGKDHRFVVNFLLLGGDRVVQQLHGI